MLAETAAEVISSAVLRDRIDEVETTLAGLTDAAAAAGVKSYGNPEDAALRQAADEAMAALHSAQRELDRLRIALPAAEQHEAEQQAAEAQATRQRAKDKLIAEQERIGDRYLKLEGKIAEDQAILETAELEADVLADEWHRIDLKAQVYRERIGNDTRRLDTLGEQHDALDAEITAFPVTAAEVAAVEQAQRDAEQAAKDEARRRFDEDTAAEIARITGDALVDVEPARIPNGENPIGWTFSAGRVVAVPRRDLEQFEAAKARFAAAEAAREEVKLAEAARAALANAQAAAKHPVRHTSWTDPAARIAG